MRSECGSGIHNGDFEVVQQGITNYRKRFDQLKRNLTNRFNRKSILVKTISLKTPKFISIPRKKKVM